MPSIRPIQPIALPIPGLSVTTYATNATAIPIGISTDTRTVYGSKSGGQVTDALTLYESTNDGGSWTAVKAFGEQVVGIRELDDGEALVFTNSAAATPGFVYRSSGWSAGHSSATWTKTLTTVGGYIRPYWSGGHTDSFGDDVISDGTSRIGVVSEYGAQTSSSGDQTTRARRVYLTQDYGSTWTQIFDIYTRYNSLAGMHVHWSGYDPYWNRIWILIGDIFTAEGFDKYPILYSDDLGVTWTAVPATVPDYRSNAGYFQSTVMHFLPDSIVIGTDNGPAFLRMPRVKYRTSGRIQYTAHPFAHTGSGYISSSIHQNRRQLGAPIIYTLQSVHPFVPQSIHISLDGGQSTVRLWQDDAAANGGAVGSVFGPTINGSIIGTVVIGSEFRMISGELIVPDPDQKYGQGTVTGDGSKTVFTFAHGYSSVPNRYQAWQEKPAGTYTVTADATNIIITFSTAPSNTTVLPFQWRAGM